MNLRRGLAVAITLSALAVPAYILATEDPPAVPVSPPSETASNTTTENVDNAEAIKNKIDNVKQVKESVDKFCDDTPTNLEKVAKKNNVAGEGLAKFNQSISAVKASCATLKAFDPSTIKRVKNDENLNNYKRQGGQMLKDAQVAIDVLGVK